MKLKGQRCLITTITTAVLAVAAITGLTGVSTARADEAFAVPAPESPQLTIHLAPILQDPISTTDGFTIYFENPNDAPMWSAQTSSGQIDINAGTITVMGLDPFDWEASSTVTVNFYYDDGVVMTSSVFGRPIYQVIEMLPEPTPVPEVPVDVGTPNPEVPVEMIPEPLPIDPGGVEAPPLDETPPPAPEEPSTPAPDAPPPAPTPPVIEPPVVTPPTVVTPPVIPPTITPQAQPPVTTPVLIPTPPPPPVTPPAVTAAIPSSPSAPAPSAPPALSPAPVRPVTTSAVTAKASAAARMDADHSEPQAVKSELSPDAVMLNFQSSEGSLRASVTPDPALFASTDVDNTSALSSPVRVIMPLYPEAPKGTINKAAKSSMDAPTISGTLNDSVAPIVKSLPKSVKMTATITINGKTIRLGSLQTNADGTVKLPKFRPTKAGTYLVQLMTKNNVKYFVKIVVKAGK